VVVVLIAPLLGFAARRRKAKLAVMTTYRAMLGLCGAGLLGGIVAAATGQPYTVYFPLLLLGLIGGGVFGMNYRKMGASYEEPPEAVIEA
jgi:heme A synthase